MLVVNTILPTASIVLPTTIGEAARQDSPIAIIFCTLIGLGVAALIGTIIRTNQGAYFIDWVRDKCSPLLATLLGLLMLQFYLDTTATILREFINFINDNVLVNTPVTILTLFITVISIYMVRQGLEAIARINSLVLLLYIIFIPVYILGLSKYMDFHRLLPLFDHSISSLTIASLTPITWVSEVGILLFLAPYLQNPDKARIIGYTGLLVVGLAMLLIMVAALLVYGPKFITANTYPGFSVIGLIRLGNVIERLDILFISYWVLSVYLKMSIFLFATVECFKQTFRVKLNRPFIGALGLVVALECIFTWQDGDKLATYNKHRFLVFFLFNALIPLVLLIWDRVQQQLKSKKKGWGT